MRKVNPKLLLLYIGEDYGGCTADDDFFDNVEHVDDIEFYKISRKYRTWYGLNDTLRLYK